MILFIVFNRQLDLRAYTLFRIVQKSQICFLIEYNWILCICTVCCVCICTVCCVCICTVCCVCICTVYVLYVVCVCVLYVVCICTVYFVCICTYILCVYVLYRLSNKCWKYYTHHNYCTYWVKRDYIISSLNLAVFPHKHPSFSFYRLFQ